MRAQQPSPAAGMRLNTTPSSSVAPNLPPLCPPRSLHAHAAASPAAGVRLDTKPSSGGMRNRSSGDTTTSKYTSPRRYSCNSMSGSRSRTHAGCGRLAVFKLATSSADSSRYSASAAWRGGGKGRGT
eukprot:272765-Chlamydomonas_euryale.AAC.1